MTCGGDACKGSEEEFLHQISRQIEINEIASFLTFKIVSHGCKTRFLLWEGACHSSVMASLLVVVGGANQFKDRSFKTFYT